MNTLKIVALLLLGGWVLSCTRNINPAETIDKFPDIFPDYVGVTVPASIAPLNFRLNGEVQECVAKISGEKGASIRIKGQKKLLFQKENGNNFLN